MKRSDQIATGTARDAHDRVSQSGCANLRELSKTRIWGDRNPCREDQIKASVLALSVGGAYSMCLLVLLFASNKWLKGPEASKTKTSLPRSPGSLRLSPDRGDLCGMYLLLHSRWKSPAC